ncbi:MAG: hypothetical protein PVI66_00495 [Candidatus Aminicenantes bacterium]|jgi:hypothetical protein
MRSNGFIPLVGQKSGFRTLFISLSPAELKQDTAVILTESIA